MEYLVLKQAVTEHTEYTKKIVFGWLYCTIVVNKY